ncbi:MAG: aminotransferase [Bacteroidetes bacterium HGW-Bacteroidetes-6]|jgi:2-aminoadipate transaminase|nr:MAG: aminotransferase [Bacteroidetes bacterium HGW-Bacteroidetes-6]
METSYEHLWSDSIKKMKKSVIRELLKLTQKDEIISFAGGLPDPKLFPIEDIKDCTNAVLDKYGPKALQYGTTEGDIRLRSHLVKRYRDLEGLNISEDNLIVTTASQQGLDLTGRIFINPGDAVFCGLPSYLGGINAFASYGADLIGIELDNDGMSSILLREAITRAISEGKKAKFIYIVPDFQNPAGITMNEKRRKEILDIAYEFNIPIIEDTPYREVRFNGTPQPMFQKLDTRGLVITLGTFSKVLAPGFRIGWVIGHQRWVEKYVTGKQIADLCSSALIQMTIAEYFERNLYDKNLKVIIEKYREKRDAMLLALEKYMPDGVTWTTPDGGLFLFLYMPDIIDSEKLFLKAIEKNVAFVVGHVFYCNNAGKNTMRLNFSFATLEENDEGIRRLSESIKEFL